MSKKNNKGQQQQQGQNQQGQQQHPAPPPRPVKKEREYPAIYCYKNWNGNLCTVTITVVSEKGEPVQNGVIQIFGEEIVPVRLKTDKNGSAHHKITMVKKEIVFGVALLGTPASTWVNLFYHINEQEVVSRLSALRFRM